MLNLLNTPLFGITITLAAYAASLLLQARFKWLHPLLITSGCIVIILLLCRIPYAYYQTGGDILVLLLGPATVALAVPLYKQYERIREHWRSIGAGVVAGSITGMAVAAALVKILHGSQVILLTMLPKSVTSPIAIELVRMLGGIPPLGAVLTVLTGLFGSMVGPTIFKLARIENDIAIGVAMGTAAHGIGTARVIRNSELQGSMSGFAMGLAGVLVSLMVIPIHYLL